MAGYEVCVRKHHDTERQSAKGLFNNQSAIANAEGTTTTINKGT